jgi:hypothetical protein
LVKQPKNDRLIDGTFTWNKANDSSLTPRAVKIALHAKRGVPTLQIRFKDGAFGQPFRGLDALELLWTTTGKVHLHTMYSYDLHHRFNNFTVPFAAWTQLTVATDLNAESEPKPLGLFLMVEPVDEAFVRHRFPQDKRGTLLFYDEKKIDEQTKNLSNLNRDLFLRILAVNERLNNQDDYRSSNRNYAVYVDDRKKVHWISFGFEKTLVANKTAEAKAKATTRPLIAQMIARPEASAQYGRYLNLLNDPNRHLLDAKKSAPRIEFWERLAGDSLAPYDISVLKGEKDS